MQVMSSVPNRNAYCE